MGRVELKQVFLSLQDELEARLQAGRAAIRHPGTKGDAAELNWRELLSAYLPQRYSVTKAFVVDGASQCSDQIDLVIHDRHYSPLLFNHAGAVYLPAESVYGVLEIKQEITRHTIAYAGKKAASVRRLNRTSVRIPSASGGIEPREPFRIIAGILALEAKPRAKLEPLLKKELPKSQTLAQLDIGCAIRSGSFSAEYGDNRNLRNLDISRQRTALVFFLLRLIQRLRDLATAPAIDFSGYERFL